MLILYLMVCVGVLLALLNREGKSPKLSIPETIVNVIGWPILFGYLLINKLEK